MLDILHNLANKHILVMGYGVTGRSVVDFLLSQQANVTLNDRGNLLEDSSVHLLLSKGVKVVDGGHPMTLLDEPIDFIVKNPGIPYHVPFVAQAMAQGIPIYTDVEIAYWIAQAPIIGITGSNGKTTTTSLMQQLLSQKPSGTAYLAGNIGVPAIQVAQGATSDDVIVMELSSFQLMGIETFKPHVAVLTNITSAHLDYHGSQTGYEQAKLQLVANQAATDYVVYNHEDETIKAYVATAVAQKIPFATTAIDDFVREQGAYVLKDQLMFRGEAVASLSDLAIPGQHNVQNALAAIAVAKLYHVSNESIQHVLRQYQGMPYRLQPIAESAGRRFYNDSKSTNMVATITALTSFEQPIRYIGGGLDRGNAFDDLVPYLGHVESAYLYGESKDKMALAFEAAGVSEVHVLDTLEEATTLAYQAAQVGEVVLFSPSCASWDQYKNFEQRGAAFTDCVAQLLTSQPY